MKGKSVKTKTRYSVAAIASALALGFALTVTGCASTPAAPKPTPSPTISIPAPLNVDLKSYDGKAIDLPMNRVLVIFENGKAAVKISGTAADDKIVQYVDAYSADAGKTFAPGVLPLTKGTTTVTIKGGDLAKPVDVKVTVVDPITSK